MNYTSDDLVTAVRRYARLGSGQGLTDQEILDVATDEIWGRHLPIIVRAREDYYLRNQDYTITGENTSYEIPSSAIGAALRDVVFVTSDGGEVPAQRIPLDQYPLYQNGLTSSVLGVVIEGNKVRVVGPMTGLSKLRLKILQRPGRLVPASGATGASRITGFDFGGANLVLETANVPTAWITADVKFLDWIIARPNFGYVYRTLPVTFVGTDVTLTSVSTADVGDINDVIALGGYYGDYLARSLSTDVADGDHLVPETPIVQLPVEFQPALRYGTTAKVLNIMGFADRAAVYEGMTRSAFDLAQSTIEPRTHNAPQQVLNESSPLRNHPRQRFQ